MANTFKNTAHSAITAEQQVYLIPVGVGIVIGFHIANTGASDATINVTASGIKILDNVTLPVGATLSPIIGKLIIQFGESILVSSDISVDSHVSVMEIT